MNSTWINTTERYVCFLDIMGFKDMVARHPHEIVLERMEIFLDVVKKWEKTGNDAKKDEVLSSIFPNSEIRVATFSDSILLITKGNDTRDLTHLLLVIKLLISDCLKMPIPIKGAISKGLMTANFEKSLFFGKPLIQAYELQEELNYYGVIADRYVEEDLELEENRVSEKYYNLVLRTETPLKSGKISCVNISLHDDSTTGETLKQLYYSVDGKPRMYVDNTIKMFNLMTEHHKSLKS